VFREQAKLTIRLILQKPSCLRFVSQVSFDSDKGNRAPTFDMDLSDFVDSNGDPISYEAARQYFEQDASQK
jgi:hypothetical protein